MEREALLAGVFQLVVLGLSLLSALATSFSETVGQELLSLLSFLSQGIVLYLIFWIRRQLSGETVFQGRDLLSALGNSSRRQWAQDLVIRMNLQPAEQQAEWLKKELLQIASSTGPSVFPISEVPSE